MESCPGSELTALGDSRMRDRKTPDPYLPAWLRRQRLVGWRTETRVSLFSVIEEERKDVKGESGVRGSAFYVAEAHTDRCPPRCP